jgi:DNA-binding SARP family transcriptional activator/predicted ATPase
VALQTPTVTDGTLHGGPTDPPIAVGAPAWFEWLETATTFTYTAPEPHAGRFTARRERPAHGRGGSYWKAYRRSGGRLRRIYLGRSAALTLHRLEEAALLLAGANREPRPPRLTTRRGHAAAAKQQTTVRVRLLGEFSIAANDAPLSLTSSRMQSLLTYLAVHRDAPRAREQLAFVFWPDSTETQARGNLRQLLHQLRRAWPAAATCLVADATSLAWAPDVVLHVDVAEFEHALTLAAEAEDRGDTAAARRELEHALAVYGADLAPGCYADWIQPERERIRHLRTRAFDRLVALLEDARAYGLAIQYTEDSLLVEPLDETKYVDLMRVHTLNGDRLGAMRVYHRCASMLERELGVGPSPETRAAFARLVRTDNAPRQPQAPAQTAIGSAPLTGRAREWEQLESVWRQVCGGAGSVQLVLIEGEPGIGKSRLAEDFAAAALSRQGVLAARSRAYAAEGRLSYAPIADWLHSDALRPGLARLEAVWRTEIARLLPELGVDAARSAATQPLQEAWQRERFFQALARAALTQGKPLLLVLDDLQWCDQESLEWLHYFLRLDPRVPVLILGTTRSGAAAAGRPLADLLANLRASQLLTELELGPLDRAQTEELAAHLLGRRLDPDWGQHLYSETEGNPLFVLETLRAAVPARGSRSLQLETLPPKVRAVISERLGQLSEAARETAELAATVGRAFTLDVLLEALPERDEERLVGGLDELWERRVVREHGGQTYDFSHDKIREVAYSGLSPARRRLLHRRVANALEHVHARDLDPVSAQIAMHYEQAALVEPAVAYHQRAAEVAQRVYANAEAIRSFRKSLTLLTTLPPSPDRDARELALNTALGSVLVATHGYGAAEVMPVYRRSWDLCHQLGKPPSPPILRALAIEALAHTEFELAHNYGDHLLSLAARDRDPVLMVEGHYVVGVTLFWKGAFEPSRDQLSRALEHYSPARLPDHLGQYAQDPRVVCLIRMAVDLLLLGEAQQALDRSSEALALARDLAHPFSLGYALAWSCVLHNLRQDVQSTAGQAAACIDVSRQHGLSFWLGLAMVLGGWATAVHADADAGIDQMRRGMTAFAATGSRFLLPYFHALLAEQYVRLGYVQRGLTLVSEALATAQRTGERWCTAELLRARGEYLLLSGDHASAQASLLEALQVARYQQARTFELRALASLAHGNPRST